ncbi:MAG: amidohydrolase, partial [Spirochaetota bacterium]
HFGDPELLTAEEVFAMGTGAAAGLGTQQGVYPHISSEIKAGAHADLLLIDPDHVQMVPNYNLISNLVYSAGAAAVDTLVCRGKVLMRSGQVDGEEDTVRHARRCAQALIKRA